MVTQKILIGGLRVGRTFRLMQALLTEQAEGLFFDVSGQEAENRLRCAASVALKMLKEQNLLQKVTRVQSYRFVRYIVGCGPYPALVAETSDWRTCAFRIRSPSRRRLKQHFERKIKNMLCLEFLRSQNDAPLDYVTISVEIPEERRRSNSGSKIL